MTDSDGALVARIRRGDEGAADVLLRRHFRSAYLVAFARAGNALDAEDICQDAFIKCLGQLHSCRAPDRFGAWLVQIVRNTAYNHMAYLRVRATEPLASHEALTSGERTDASLERHELRAVLTGALARLTTVQREVVLLHDLEGLRHAEIAARLEISTVMSRRHLSDARKALRGILGEYATLERDHD